MSQTARRNLTLGLIILVILYLFGIRIDHPKGGLSNALGSASSSLAIYKHGNVAKIGDKVVSRSEVKGASPAIGVVMGLNSKFYDVQNGIVLEAVIKKDLRGRLIAVIPFIGAILNVVGL
jgi:hypothetical protein